MNIWVRITLVAIAGGLGAAARYLIVLLLKNSPLGFATWVINSIGCLVIGILSGWLANNSCLWNEQTRTAFTLLTMTGFCGGFSTFSSFTLDSVKYYEAGQFLTWLIFGAMTIFVGLFGCALGYYIDKHI